MKLRSMGWPIVGQVASAGFAALSSTLIYVWLSGADAIDYFASVAIVSMGAAFGAFGQRRVLPRDMRAETVDIVPLLIVRGRLILGTSVVAAGVGALALRLLQIVSADRALGIAAIIAVWIVGESFRGVVADVQLGFHNDRLAALTGDGLRWAVHLFGIVLLARTASLTVLLIAGAVASWFTLGAALLVLVRQLRGRWQPSATDRTSGWARLGLMSGFIVAVNSFAVMMTTQLSTVTAALGLSDDAATDFSFGMRIAAGFAILQAGTAKFVLPRAVGLRKGDDGGLGRDILKITAVSTSAAVAGLVLILGVLLVAKGGVSALFWIVGFVGLGNIANVAAGPAGTVLIANRAERVVLISNLFFGTLAALAPLLGRFGVRVELIAVGVGCAIAMHHGVNAAVLSRLLDQRVGFWRMPIPAKAAA